MVAYKYPQSIMKNIIYPLLNVGSNAVLSLSTLLVGIILIKSGMEVDYGNFVFYSAILLFAQGVTYSTFTTYLIINIEKRDQIYIQANNSILLILVISLLISPLVETYSLLMVSAVMVSFFDFNRQYFMSRDEFRYVLLGDISMAMSKIVVIFLYSRNELLEYFKIQDLFSIIFLPPLTFYLYVLVKRQIRKPSFTFLTISNVAKSVKWSFFENIVHNFNSQMHVFFLKFFMGEVSLAAYATLNSVFSLLNMFFNGVSQYFLPKLRVLYINSKELFEAYKKKIFTSYMIVAISVACLVNILSKELFQTFYTLSIYNEVKSFLLLFSILFILRICVMYYTAVNKAMNLYKNTFIVKVYIAIASTILMFLIMPKYSSVDMIVVIQIVVTSISVYLLGRRV